MAKKHIVGIAALALLLASCGGDDSSGDGTSAQEDDTISGDITVLTHRTDIVDTVLEDYKERFQQVYPDVDVSFEAITDYEGDVTIRLNTEEYGNVLMIPATVTRDQLPDYFEPLGTVEELQEKYRFVEEQTYQGDAYGIAIRTGRSYIALVRALGAVVTVADPYLSEDEARRLGVWLADLETVLRSSRVLALHAPVLPETTRMLGARELALLPDRALLVNTARAALVDTDALLAELGTGRIDAALDVFDEEPLPTDHPFRALPNVLLTPHQAAGTVESRVRGGELVVAEIARFLSGEPLEHEVTHGRLSRMG